MKEIKLTFAPGAFDSFTGTQEELDALILELQQMIDSGEIWNNLTPIENLSEEELVALPDLGNRTLH